MKSKDDLIWIKINVVTVGLTDDLFIGFCYVVPEGSSRFIRNEENTFDWLIDYIAKIHLNTDSKCNIMLCGGLNSRTATIADSVPYDAVIDEIGFLDDYIADSFINRSSQDKGANTNGQLFIDICRQTGLIVLNGRVGNDLTIGKCTLVGSRGNSRIDYVLASEDIFKCVLVLQ